jgi:hypothetical protein
MKTLNFPQYPFKVIQEDKKTKIFDVIRKAYYVLTPEEWVRQHLIQFMIRERNYPKGLIAIEKGMKLNGLQKRFDGLVYQKNGEAIMLIECKAPEITINQAGMSSKKIKDSSDQLILAQQWTNPLLTNK